MCELPVRLDPRCERGARIQSPCLFRDEPPDNHGEALTLFFPRPLQEELIAHAREGDPEEVCGILAGRQDRVERVFRVRNAADEVHADTGVFRDRDTGEITGGRKRVHYYMDPKDQLRVYNAVDDLQMDVVGYYHSHTFTEPRPSPTDVRLARDMGSTYWILVSLREKHHPEVKAWKILKDDPEGESGEVIEQPIAS